MKLGLRFYTLQGMWSFNRSAACQQHSDTGLRPSFNCITRFTSWSKRAWQLNVKKIPHFFSRHWTQAPTAHEIMRYDHQYFQLRRNVPKKVPRATSPTSSICSFRSRWRSCACGSSIEVPHIFSHLGLPDLFQTGGATSPVHLLQPTSALLLRGSCVLLLRITCNMKP